MAADASYFPPLIRVHDISQEYWFIRRSSCTCGGEFKALWQRLVHGDRGAMDVVSVGCTSCGRQREFVFDISSFYMGSELGLKLWRLLREIEDEALKERLSTVSPSPVGDAAHTIVQLAERGDVLALEWLSDVIEEALRRLRAGT